MTRIIKGSAAIFISFIFSIVFTVIILKFLNKTERKEIEDKIEMPDFSQIKDIKLKNLVMSSHNKIKEIYKIQKGSGLEIESLKTDLKGLLLRQIDLCERVNTYRSAINNFNLEEKDDKLQKFFGFIDNETDENIIEDYRKTINSIEESISEYYEICKLEKTINSKIERITNFLNSVELKLYKLKDAYKKVSTTDLKNEMENIRKEIDSFSQGINELNL